jgi:hypothetical protein
MATRLLVILVAAALAACSGCAEDLTVPIPPGETYLRDIGIYRVAYQSYGGQVVEMPPSWIGHFEAVSGISYLPDEYVSGRSAILLHSPWHVPPGRAWVDYRLRLPDIRPITLSFGIAMGPDVVVPGRSDGVTFSAYLIAGGQERELVRKHRATAEWLDYSFDLSTYAGKQVAVRLQVEPGPKNDSGWDYSYFGNARIAAGSAQQGRKALLERLTSSHAYRATEHASLEALASDPSNGIVPGNLLPCRNSITKVGGAYRFTYNGADCALAYTYTPKDGTLDDFAAAVDGGRSFLPAQGGRVTFAVKQGDAVRSVPGREGRLVRCALADDGKAVEAVWAYPAASAEVQVTWRFSILNKALVISASCEDPIVSAFSLGQVGGAALRRSIYVPYMPADWGRGAVSYLPDQALFVCRYLDWTVSHSSRCPQGEAEYDTRTDGTRNPMAEKGYVAVSPSFGEVLPNAPHPPSPHRKLLAPLPMLDIWGHHNGTYLGDAGNLRTLKDNGVDHLAIIQHVWQRYGYDTKLPDHMPANPEFGGDQGMIEFGKAARECGYVWSLHENYIDLYPDAPSYDPSARVLQADGKPSPAWFNGSVQSFGLKCNRALGYAKMNAPEAHRRYGTNAAYLDVHTCVPPWHQLDHEASQPMAAMALAKVKHDTELFQFMRVTHGGPLFGEGANQFYWAGRCDGVEAQVAGGENHVPLLDFDLLKLHPQMVNHGMGYYERWFTAGYSHRFGWDTGTPEQVDKYRAQELAYGHAGFIGAAQVDNVQWVAKEYCLMHPVQALYGAAKVRDLEYCVDGRWVNASVALALDERLRQRITYDTGLTVWVNWAPEPWEVEGRLLPQWGFLALGPKTEASTSLFHSVFFCDYVDCPEYVFADARTHFNMPYIAQQKDIEPRLSQFEHLGNGRVRLSYEWVVSDQLDRNCAAFVHFTNPGAKDATGICFQNDHPLPKPASEWRKGETVADGPYEVTIADDGFDHYDIVIGLWDSAGRLPLKGRQAGGDRILIGRLEVTRADGKVTAVRLGDISKVATNLPGQADFTAHLNPRDTMIRFPKLSTDGSVKIERHGDSLVVVPYPREREFRVTLTLPALVPGLDPGRVAPRVRALAAMTHADLGAVEATYEGGQLTFRVGKAGAGRYVVAW